MRAASSFSKFDYGQPLLLLMVLENSLHDQNDHQLEYANHEHREFNIIWSIESRKKNRVNVNYLIPSTQLNLPIWIYMINRNKLAIIKT